MITLSKTLILAPNQQFFFKCYCSEGTCTSTTPLLRCDLCYNWLHYECVPSAKGKKFLLGDCSYKLECSRCVPKENLKSLGPNSLTQLLKIAIYNLYLTQSSYFFKPDRILEFLKSNMDAENISDFEPLTLNTVSECLEKSQNFIPKDKGKERFYSICYFKLKIAWGDVVVRLKRIPCYIMNRKTPKAVSEEELTRKKENAMVKALTSSSSFLVGSKIFNALDATCLSSLTESERKSLYQFLPNKDQNEEGLNRVFGSAFLKRDLNLYLSMLASGDFDPKMRMFRRSQMGRSNPEIHEFWGDLLVDSLFKLTAKKP